MIVKRVFPLFSSQELKELAKQNGIKGHSKFKKDDLVDFIITSLDDGSLENILKTDGLKKLSETVEDALLLLKGKRVSAEEVAILDVSGNPIKGRFNGMRWTTKIEATIEEMGHPDFNFSCSCRNALGGGLCIHYWVLFMLLIAKEKIQLSALGDMKGIFSDIIKKKIPQVEISTSKSVQDLMQSIENTPLEDILKGNTQGNRFLNAKIELGLLPRPKPEPKKKKGTDEAEKDEKPKVVTVKVDVHEVVETPPVLLDVGFTRIEDGTPVEMDMRVLIDESSRIVAHENCKDFQFRMARQKKLCKHLVAVFMSIDEKFARRILCQIEGFQFLTTIPRDRQKKHELSDDVLGTVPEETLIDKDKIKDKMLDFLLKNDEGVTLDEIKEKFGKEAAHILDIMVSEGIVKKMKSGRYAPL